MPTMTSVLGLQLGDTLAGRSEFGQVAAGRAGQLPCIDEVLATPDLDRRVADAEELGDLGGLPSGCDEINDLAAELGRTAVGHHGGFGETEPFVRRIGDHTAVAIQLRYEVGDMMV
ncbi:hypothetical protein [Streptomyces mirabilis]|uniref:hypothetical protein n=1 Tax=Streptomyces mirabilis TaxID=68239 RepID=UPI00367EF809